MQMEICWDSFSSNFPLFSFSFGNLFIHSTCYSFPQHLSSWLFCPVNWTMLLMLEFLLLNKYWKHKNIKKNSEWKRTESIQNWTNQFYINLMLMNKIFRRNVGTSCSDIYVLLYSFYVLWWCTLINIRYTCVYMDGKFSFFSMFSSRTFLFGY